METIEQGLRRIFKNAPHIYAECVRCAKERPHKNWDEERSPITGSHRWDKDCSVFDFDYWNELDNRVKKGEEIGPDYPLPPDSKIRQKEVGNWYMCVDGDGKMFNAGKWYQCIGQTDKCCAFIDNLNTPNGFCPSNNEYFDLSNPLPHNPETKPIIEDIETKPEQAPEPTQKTETRIQLNEEKFSFIKNGCVVNLDVIHKGNIYHVYYNEIDVDQDNHETLLELQLEVVRFAKKRLNETTSPTLEQIKA